MNQHEYIAKTTFRKVNYMANVTFGKVTKALLCYCFVDIPLKYVYLHTD